MASEVRVVLVTAPDMDCGRRLGRDLVQRRLAACVNLLPGLISIYAWQGELQEDGEVLLLVKTRAAHLPALESFLEAEHPYDTPEMVALEPAQVEARYQAWLMDWTQTEGPA